jgi:hypothetical protein
LSEGCRAHSLAMETSPSLVTTADDCGISLAVSQSGKYSHVHVSISHPQTRAVLSFDEEIASEIRTTTEVTKQTMGQNPPALVSQTVPRQRKYWAIPTPKRHGMTPNTVAVTIGFRRSVEFSILCSFRKSKGKEPDRGFDSIADSNALVRSNMGPAFVNCGSSHELSIDPKPAKRLRAAAIPSAEWPRHGARGGGPHAPVWPEPAAMIARQRYKRLLDGRRDQQQLRRDEEGLAAQPNTISCEGDSRGASTSGRSRRGRCMAPLRASAPGLPGHGAVSNFMCQRLLKKPGDTGMETAWRCAAFSR